MEQEIWQEDQPVLVSDLDRAQFTKEQAITLRLGDEFNYGVVPDSWSLAEGAPFLITVLSSTSINVGTGIAYDSNGQRIAIDGPSLITYNLANATTQTDNGIGGTTLTPISTGSAGITITASAPNYIYITYLNTTDPTIFTISEYNNSRLFVSGTDGYRIDVEASLNGGPSPGVSIFLGEVDASETVITTGRLTFNLKPDNLLAVVPTAGQTLAALGDPYVPGQSITFPYHVKGVGTGIITPTNVHGLSLADISGTSSTQPQLFLASGLAASQTSITSALYGVVQRGGGGFIPPGYGYDNFEIFGLSSSESLLINGSTVTDAIITQNYLFYFLSAAGVPLSPGFYTIYYNATTAQLLLAANGSPAQTAYRVFGLTTSTFVNSNTLPLATVEANPNNFLLWVIDWTGATGPNSILTWTDERLFGTVNSNTLQRDSLTDTVTIQHNVDIVGDPFGVGVGNLTVAGTITGNFAGGAGGEVLYQSAPNVTSFTAAGTSGQVLTSAGAGTPTWQNSAASQMAQSAPYFSTPNGARTPFTVYNNATPNPIYVAAASTGGSNGNIDVGLFGQIGTPGSPTSPTYVVQESLSSSAGGGPPVSSIFFIVPPGYSYFVGTASIGIQSWTEWQ